MGKIVVIGSLNMDMVMKVDHMPSEGETILCDNMKLIPGGKGANQACAVGRLGAEVTMLGAIGDDTYGVMQKNSLEQSGVDVSELIVKENVNTGLAFITVNKEGNNSIVVVSGANAQFTPEDIDRQKDVIAQSEIVILQLEIPLNTVLYAAKLAKLLGKTVILDPAPAPKQFPEEMYQYVDIIKPNETELSGLTGIPDAQEHLKEAVQILKDRGARNVLVTLGGDGAYLDAEGEPPIHIAARKVEVVDTTAAGDAFTAAMASMLAEGKTLKEAAQFANLVSAIVVTREGAQSSIPTLQEVLKIY